MSLCPICREPYYFEADWGGEVPSCNCLALQSRAKRAARMRANERAKFEASERELQDKVIQEIIEQREVEEART